MTPIVIIPLYGACCKDFLIPCLCFPIHKQNIHILLFLSHYNKKRKVSVLNSRYIMLKVKISKSFSSKTNLFLANEKSSHMTRSKSYYLLYIIQIIDYFHNFTVPYKYSRHTETNRCNNFIINSP